MTAAKTPRTTKAGKPDRRSRDRSKVTVPEGSYKLSDRPTKYDPAMCQTVLDAGSEGKSKRSISRVLKISWSTLQEWERRYPEFAEALKAANDACFDWYEDKGRKMIKGEIRGNATIFQFMARSIWPDHYRAPVEAPRQPGDSPTAALPDLSQYDDATIRVLATALGFPGSGRAADAAAVRAGAPRGVDQERAPVAGSAGSVPA